MEKLKNMEGEEINKPKMGVKLALFLLIIGIILIGFIAFNRSIFVRNLKPASPETQKSANTIDAATSRLTGMIGLTTKGGQTTFSKGQKVTLFVYADSKGQDITGYDAVVRYDHTYLAFEEVKSLPEGIDIYETNDEMSSNFSDLIVTGVKSLNHEDPFIFDNTAVAEITFTALERGEVNLSLVYEPGSSSDSNLIDNKNLDILNDIVGTTLVIN